MPKPPPVWENRNEPAYPAMSLKSLLNPQTMRNKMLYILSFYLLVLFSACKKDNETAAPGTNNTLPACDEIPVNNAPFTTCGNIKFQTPPDWKLEPEGENFILRLPFISGNPDRFVNMLVVKGFASSGNIETDYNTVWQKYLSDFTKYQEPFLIKDKSIKGYDIIRGGTNIRNGNNAPLYVHVWVAKVKDQAEAAFTFANYNNDFDIAFYGSIAPFWARLQFNNLPAPAKPCYTLRGNGIQGIYYGLANGLDIYGNYGKKLSWLMVYSDGKMKRINVLPYEGINGFDRETDREINKDYWADYNLQTGKATFTGNTPQVKNFTYNSNKLFYDDQEYAKLANVDGLTLSGVYSADSSPTAITTFGYEPVITFYKDGRFEDKTALYYVNSIFLPFKTPGNGKYKINNYTIDLTYDDGRGSASFPFVSFDKENFTSIQIGNVFIFKK
jgi:hypothetical protein